MSAHYNFICDRDECLRQSDSVDYERFVPDGWVFLDQDFGETLHFCSKDCAVIYLGQFPPDREEDDQEDEF